MKSIYEAAGGWEGLLKLAGAWHARVMEDEVVSHAFSHGFHPQHTERLAAYWAEALGGPSTYSGRYGDETSVVRTHSGNGLHEEMDQRAIACFDRALEDVGLARDERLYQVLHDYFAWATTNTMARYHRSADDVPAGLTMPKWNWDGLVTLDRRGSCQCGEIRYAAPAVPLELWVCHCKECQKQSSSAFGISYTVRRDQFEVTQGEPSFWTRATLTGKTLTCAFCRNCGSRLWHQSTGAPDTLNVKAGTLAGPVDLTAAIHVWTSSKLPGVVVPAGAVSFEKEPP